MNKEIALDTDGVILNFLDKYTALGSELLDREVKQVSNKYSLSARFGITQEQAALIWDEFGKRKYWRSLDPLPGALEAIDLLKSAEYKIHIVTAIADQYKDLRMENFAVLGFNPHSIHCTPNGRLGKIKPIEAIDPVAYVDDRLEHLHNSLHVPQLVWIDHGDEQFPETYGRHDVRTHSLLDWAKTFISAPHTHTKKTHKIR